MKNRILIALAVASCILASCQVEVIDSNTAKEPLVFSATIGNESATRTAIDITGTESGGTGSVTWTENDQITVTCLSGADKDQTAIYKADQTGAESTLSYVSGTVFTDPNASYSAIYGNIDNQTYSATGANCPMAAPATSTRNFQFIESAAMLKFNVKADGKSVRYIKAAGKTLDCGESGVALNTSTGTDFYLAIPAGTYQKLNFTFIATDNSTCSKSFKSEFTIAANSIQPIQLDNALTFATAPTETVTYYLNDGSVVSNPVTEGEGANTGFSAQYSTWQHENDNFKLAFSSAKGNAIDFANGDIIELEITAVGVDYPLLFGNDSSDITGKMIELYTNDKRNWWKPLDANDNSTFGKESREGINLPLLVRISGEGLQIFDNDAYTTLLSSTNPTLASILTLGKENAFYIGLYGKANVASTATYGYLKVTRGIAPTAVTGVELSLTSKTIQQGQHFTLTANVLPAGASTKTVNWASSNTSVATVDNSGKVTGVVPGTATITVFTKDGDFHASCEVTVTAPTPVTSIDLQNVNVAVGGNYTIIPTVLPNDAANKNVTWSSSDENVATISESGVVTGIAVGSATITATAADGSGVTGTCTVTVTATIPDVYLWQNLITLPIDKVTPEAGDLKTKSLSIIAKTALSTAPATDTQICFENGDYIEMKFKKNVIPTADRDLVYIYNTTSTNSICVISHPTSGNKTVECYFCPSGWSSAAQIQNIDVDTYVFFRFGVDKDGVTGGCSYSLNGTDWSNWSHQHGPGVWAELTTVGRTFNIQTARSYTQLVSSTYEYVKIVRGQ